MKPILLLIALLGTSCVSVQQMPDDSLFPDKSTDWHDGFKAGMTEGLLLSVTIPW
jgi:hypothetical protein